MRHDFSRDFDEAGRGWMPSASAGTARCGRYFAVESRARSGYYGVISRIYTG